MAKGFKTGGRRKGTPNKTVAAMAAEIERTGETPLEFLIRAMRAPKRDFNDRMEAAKAAAPYVHPKLAAIEHTGSGGAPLIPGRPTPDHELAKRICFLLAAQDFEAKNPSNPEKYR